MPLVVYKLGGSLLTLGDLERRLTGVLKQPLSLPTQAAAGRPLEQAVLVGGGQAADVVRNWDRSHKLGAERSHDLALAAMAFNARLVNSLLHASELVPRRSLVRKACARGMIAVLDPAVVLAEAERRASERLPRSWDVTSDSIAAFLAIEWRAAALVLIKSTPRPAGLSPIGAARRGAVDRYFPHLAARIPLVAWANLRSKRPTIQRWF
jgi:5-(aminomethyl)-3-furanmethanol phosphate kinase